MRSPRPRSPRPRGGARRAARRAHRGPGAPGRRGRELLGKHRRPARRQPRDGDEHRRQTPPSTRTATSRPPRTPASMAGREGRDRERDRLRQLGLAAPRREPRRAAASSSTPANVLGLGDGDNPHQWYSPASVRTDGRRDRRGLPARRPGGRRVLRGAPSAPSRRSGLARYDALRAAIRTRFAGMPVGYSESIFEPLGASLGLKLLTPPGFAKAVAEGTEVSAADKADGRAPARRPPDRGVGLQQPERHAGGRAAHRARAGPRTSRSRR